MEAFPFTNEEWAAVREAALPVVNATLATEGILRSSHFGELKNVLDRLRARHGNHPVLLETEADFAVDDGERLALYQWAVHIADKHRLPTLSIRLSLAELLLGMGKQDAASDELLACEGEMGNGEDSEKTSWAALVKQLKGAGPHDRRDI